jgi:ABC-type amino acid transport substrate-binding protein
MRRFGLALIALVALLAPPRLAPSAAASEGREAEVARRGALRICIWPEYFTISYRNRTTGEFEGIDIDLARAFAADLGVRPEFVETNFRDFMDALERGACDIAMFGVGVTPPRAERVDFSTPHLRSRLYAVASRTGTRAQTWAELDRAGRVIAVAAGTIMEPIMEQRLEAAELLVVRPPATRESEVQAGRADAFVSDYPYTRRILQLHDWARIIELPEGFPTTDYAYAVAKGQPAWLARVNRFVADTLADGRLAAAAARHGLREIALAR